jgi:Outer membrane lipoprotein-sorting protein
MNGALIGLLCSFGVAQQATSPAMPLDAIIQAIQKAQAARPQASYQIIREYRLFGAKDSKANSEVVAEINFRPPSSRGYTIQSSWGSNRGPQVVRRILDHEAEVSSKDKGRSAITSDNYSFNYIGEVMLDGQACYLLGLKPKRTEQDLVSGQIWVDKNSFLIRQIQGELEKTPSWWLKTVHIKLTFAELQGIWVQKNMEATADVRIVGAHTLTSRILDYRREAEVAATPLVRDFKLTAPSGRPSP